jgi:DNA-binding LacI/PurR family transcriptional regulator
MALGALSLAKRRGLKVPDDLSIVGFDNIALSEFCDPPLTTVHSRVLISAVKECCYYWIKCRVIT